MIFTKLLIVLAVIFLVSKVIDSLRDRKKKYASVSGSYVFLDGVDAILWSGQAIFFFVFMWSSPIGEGDLLDSLIGALKTTISISLPFALIWASVFWVFHKCKIHSRVKSL